MRYGAYLSVLSLLGCNDPFGPENPVRFDPPVVYADWWGEAEQCTGLTADMGRVEWFSVERLQSSNTDGFRRAQWEPPHRIYIIATRLNDQQTVQHEILHDLLDGDPEHAHSCWVTLDLLF